MIIDHAWQLLAVRDQGHQRGTCLVFATTAAHEHARYRRRSSASPELSVDSLFWHCKQLDGSPDDDGTGFEAARTALADPGHCEEMLWPYDPTRDITAYYQPPTAACHPDNLRRGTMTAISTDIQAVGDAIRAGHTVVAGIQLWESFYDCDAANLDGPQDDIDDDALHAVCLVGIDDDQGRVKIRNSWGTRWGQGGYAWLPFDGFTQALIEAWTVEDDLDSD